MNINTESKHAVKQDSDRFSKPIPSSSTARLGMSLIAAGRLLAVTSARAQTEPSAADKAFILAAARGGMSEVKLGELASKKAKRDDVKAFGELMVKDHTAINGDLKSLAALKGVTLPAGLDAKHQAMVDTMAALKGADFDNAYIDAMINDHKMDAKELKAESGETQDTDIKSFHCHPIGGQNGRQRGVPPLVWCRFSGLTV